MKKSTGDDEGLRQIGEVADLVGLSVRTIRHWEEVGLLTPSDRSPGGFRLYGAEEVERLLLLKQFKPMEFSLDEMRDLMGVRDQLLATASAEERAALRDRMEMFLALIDERRERLREQLGQVDELQHRLRVDLRRSDEA